MSNNLLSIWRSSCEIGFSTIIVPDGCRDLIMKTMEGEKPRWFVSPLFDQSTSIFIEDNSNSVGFRLRPGVDIKEQELLSYIEHKNMGADEVKNILGDFISIDGSIDEALACLAGDVISIKQAAARLGVSIRTLQRLVHQKTRRTPGYWFQLARVRKAAKRLNSESSLAEVAETYGFADQPHMSREFRHWFRFTPAAIIKMPEIIEQLNDTGYA